MINPEGVTIRTFGSMEEALGAMARATEMANRHLAADQRMITWGDRWVRFWQMSPTMPPIVIFGRVMTREEIEAGERACMGDTPQHEVDGEIAQTLRHIEHQHGRGYMFGKAYSVMESEGELGDTHRADMWPISERVYEAARKVQWNHRNLPRAEAHALVEAYQAWAGHTTKVRELMRRTAKTG